MVLNKGTIVKVFLKGESPWAYVLDIVNGNVIGRIDNDLIFTDIHGYKRGDVLEFYQKDYGKFKSLEPIGHYQYIRIV